MENNFESEIKNIVSGKLTDIEIEELIYFIKQALSHAMDQDDDDFYKEMTAEMTGNVKDLALVLIDFRKDFKHKIRPHIEDIATKYIPQTSDQLEGIIEATEDAANTIMDNLDRMGQLIEENKKVLSNLEQGVIRKGDGSRGNGADLDAGTVKRLAPALSAMTSNLDDNMRLIGDIFTQMSFQDLTGQRLQRIIKLVGDIEDKIRAMVISFGLKLKARENNPNISSDELKKIVDEKAQLLAGPQKKGDGLDQADIDDLLGDLF